MNTKLRFSAVLFAITLALVWCIPSVGQVIKGSISGSVVDPQGAVVSGAEVKAKNIETGVVNTTVSDSSGNFRLNLLPVGTYNLDITIKGFKTASQRGVSVAAGADSGVGAIHLTVGETSTTVEVTAAAPLIETTQSQVTSTFSGITLSTFAGIEENEGLDRLALFVPGVHSSRSNNFSNTNGASISNNGLRGRNNDQEIDGQNNNDNSVGGPGLFLSDAEFVQQYVIVTNQFGPEYGRNSGSVVNLITKSGTNAWHGSVYGTERSNYMDALSNTQKNTNKPGSPPCAAGVVICNPFSGPPRYNEEFSGFTAGGPVVKNKAFLFGGFNSDLFSGNGVFTTTSTTPTPAGLAQLGGCGVLATPLSILQKFGPYAFAGNPTPRNVTTINIGTCTNPAPGFANSRVEVGGVTRIVPTPVHQFNFVNRADWQIGGDQVTARYLFNRGNTFNGSDFGAAGWFLNTTALSQAVLLSETHNFGPRMVNEARVSFSRLNVQFGGNQIGNIYEPTADHLLDALTNITISGGVASIGPATNLPQARLVNTWQAQDNWNWVLGKHAFKAGVNWTYQRSPNIFLPNINGQYNYASLNAFLGGQGSAGCPGGPASAFPCGSPNSVTIAQGNPVLDFREYDTFLYLGDDWKLSPNLTLNLGVTWTYYGSPANLFNNITTARESNPATAFWLPSLPLNQRTNAAIPGVMNSIGPSVGFAYTPQWGGFLTGHGKTTFRGGYRRLYDPPFYNIFVNISSSAPMTFLQSLSTFNPTQLPLLPTGPNVRAALSSFITPGITDPRTNSETNIASDFGPDVVDSWNFGLQREVSKSSVIEARYVGNRATNLFQTVNGNPYLGTAAKPGLLQTFPQLIPNASALTPCAATTQVGPNAGTDVGRVSCGFGSLRTRNNGGYSNYHAIQLEYRANNLFKQLTVRSGYTWSKNLDNVSEIFSTGTAGTTLFGAQNPFNTTTGEYSISGLNIPQAWTISFTEQLPFFKEQHGFIGHVLGGWSISADYILASGQPYTPRQGNIFGRIAASTTCGTTGAVCTGTNPNYYDSRYVGAFSGETARPFWGNRNAPEFSVGIYAGDACSFFGVGCSLAATQLISVNALNAPQTTPVIALSGCLRNAATCPLVNITTNDVRYIINAKTAQSIFGTPFGNVPRNPQHDAISNIANVSLFKNFRLSEHTHFEIHATALNALNHFNFTSIDPNIENAGLQNNFGSGFASPAVTTAGGRVFYIGGKFTF